MTYNYRDDPILGPALAYWNQKRGARSMPSKQDIDPTEIPPKILPYLQMLDVIDGGARFRYRLVGTASAEAYGMDYTGKIADEIFPDDRLRLVHALYRTVVDTRLPLFSRNRYHTAKNIDLFIHRIYLPLSNDDTDTHHILGVLRFEYGGLLDNGVWGGAKLDPSWQYTETIRRDGRSDELAI